jgi:hypothetical protein
MSLVGITEPQSKTIDDVSSVYFEGYPEDNKVFLSITHTDGSVSHLNMYLDSESNTTNIIFEEKILIATQQ